MQFAVALKYGQWDTALKSALFLRDVFGRDRFWIELQHHLLPEDDALIYKFVQLAQRISVGYVATNNVHYAERQSQRLQDVLTCKFADLIVSISLIRPGPVQGNMVHPYLRRRTGVDPVRYLHPALESALSETLGVILFQEQVLKVARDLGGLTAGQGELLRRALGKVGRKRL